MRAKWRSDAELLDRPSRDKSAPEPPLEVLEVAKLTATRTRIVGLEIGDGCVNDTGEDY